MSVVVIRAERW